ncbi:hypothetical protein ABPG75_008908 [Micractinium tetrahymenae]
MQAVACRSNPGALAGQQQGVRRQPAAAALPQRQEASPPPCLDRRSLLAGAAALATAAACQPVLAIQGSIAGRIPGITGPDADGFFTYQRPEGKSGGHGVGWTEVERYSFKIPQGWEEVPVSIADLGGTEIDLRYLSPDQGNLFVVVAPVARFRDIPFNTSLDIEALGSPDQLIAGFAPELYGGPLQEDDIVDMKVVSKGGMSYYVYELTRHRLVSAAATGNRLYILAVNAKSLQWRKHSDVLLKIRDSFEVPEKVVV